MSTRKKLSVGIHLDGSLADIRTPLFKRLNEKYGSRHAVEDVKGRKFWERWGIDKNYALEEIHAMLKDPETVIPLHDSDSVKTLKWMAKEYDLQAVTTRPAEFKEMTEEWVSSYFGNSISDVHFVDPDNKSKAYARIGLPIAIENLLKDSLHLREQEVHRTPIRVVLIERPWNVGYRRNSREKGMVRADDWAHLREIVDAYASDLLEIYDYQKQVKGIR